MTYKRANDWGRQPCYLRRGPTLGVVVSVGVLVGYIIAIAYVAVFCFTVWRGLALDVPASSSDPATASTAKQ